MSNKKKQKDPASYKVRDYRRMSASSGLVATRVLIKETDLHIQSDKNIQRRAEELVLESRLQLEEYIVRNSKFYTSLSPLPKDFTAPPLIKDMFDAGRRAGVGPMAAVAGAIAEYVGRKLLAEGVQEIIIENGGDIFISRREPCCISIFAGQSPLSNTIGVELSPPMPFGVCTSSGTVGHSLSMGDADSVTVISRSTFLADAVATRLGNEVGGKRDPRKNVNRALEIAKTIEGVVGVVIICGEVMGAVGEIKLVKVDSPAVMTG